MNKPKHFGEKRSMKQLKQKNIQLGWSVLDLNLFYQKALNDTTKNYLEQVNVPTKEDIARVATLVINLENKVDNIEEFLEEK